ncbi:MAG TPA: sugar phosphate isomerase/epimerase [Bacteroidales bacterium]|nr:sugar phosphate isomerase/epimerase [Bacteroidales bacterium]
MTLSRRSFINKSATAAAAAMAAPAVLGSLLPSCSGLGKLEKFGFISGIIGKELEGDWKAILKKAAEFGFTEIETGNFLGDSAAGFLAFCKEIGIKPVAGGVGFNAGADDTSKRLDNLKELGLKYAVTYWPWLTGGPFNLADCRRSVDILNELGVLCKQKDLTLCWHNHDKEFIPLEGGLPFDFLMAHTDPDLVKCEMDIYWAKKGGADPLALLQKFPGRIPILHVKDMAPGPEQDFECPGSGIIDFPSIFREAYDQGIAHYMVERDNVPDGMACLQSSSEYLRNLRF